MTLPTSLCGRGKVFEMLPPRLPGRIFSAARPDPEGIFRHKRKEST